MNELYFDPPSKELAWLLGPCNWFGHDDVDGAEACAGICRPDVCVRPSNLTLVQDSSARFVVESVLNAAVVTEVKLRERESERRLTVFLSQRCDDVATGDSVRFVVDPVLH